MAPSGRRDSRLLIGTNRQQLHGGAGGGGAAAASEAAASLSCDADYGHLFAGSIYFFLAQKFGWKENVELEEITCIRFLDGNSQPESASCQSCLFKEVPPLKRQSS